MAINWPSAPSPGDLYPTSVSAGDPQWLFNGQGWQRVGNLGQIVSVFYSFEPVETAVDALPWLINGDFVTFTYV